MNSQWMLGSSVVAVLFAAAAVLLTRVATLYRRVPLRWIWVAASVASVTAAAMWLVPTRTHTSRALGGALPASVPGVVTTRFPEVLGTGPATLARVTRNVALPSSPPSVERVLEAGWLICSAAMLGALAIAAVRLAAERKSWRPSVIAGAEVLVSPNFGPAIVGLRRPAVVVPAWVLALDEAAQRAIVVHETEHLHARDPLLICIGLVAVTLMPWNPGMWWNWRGLRRTIELDCDARVVAHGVESAEYANVLLRAWKRARGNWMPVVAFAERASGLGARVEHLMRPEPRRRVMNTSIGMVAAALLVAVACSVPSPKVNPAASDPYPLIIIDGVPHPELPPQLRFTGRIVVETTTTPSFAIRYSGPMKYDSVAGLKYPAHDSIDAMQEIPAPASEAHFGEAAHYGAKLLYTKKYLEGGGRMIAPGEGSVAVRAMPKGASAADMADAGLKAALRGITLTPGQNTRAHAIFNDYMGRNAAITESKAPFMVAWPQRREALARRDAALRNLLTNDADRALFDTIASEHQMPSFDLEQTTRAFLSGSVIQHVKLDPAREPRALAIVRKAVLDENAAWEADPKALAVREKITADRDAALLALLTPSERAHVDSINVLIKRQRGT